MLRLWNTRSRSLEVFSPLHPPAVGMYACGPTVYGELTLGNWRKYINDDVLRRALVLSGYVVKHVVNITDVGHLVNDTDTGEDKMEREAQKTGITAWDIAKCYERAFMEGLEAFALTMPMILPRATDHIAEQIELVQTLERDGHAYRTSDGVYFDTSTFPAYGALSRQKLDEKEAGARVEVHNEKRHPADFALWKLSPMHETRQMEWDSPWGVGFPGWHIECSAMSVKYLGQPFDIHTGGVDHIAIHHENEIAQSEAHDGTPLARVWVHHEFLTVDGGRMGKSLGNGYTLHDLVERRVDPMAYKVFVLGAHYRSKLNFTWEALEGAVHALDKLKKRYLALPMGDEIDASCMQAFREAIEEDLNMPKALAVMWDMLKNETNVSCKRATLLAMDAVLGLGVSTWRQEELSIPEPVRLLAEARLQARQSKDWAASDRLREELAALGWMMEDGADTYSLTRLQKT